MDKSGGSPDITPGKERPSAPHTPQAFQYGGNMKQPEEVTLARIRAVADICMDDTVSEKIQELRLAGQQAVYPYVQGLYEGYIRTDVVMAVVEGKLEFMRRAKSKGEVKRILSPPKIHYNGNEIWAEKEFYIPEEEMLMWSQASFLAPLNKVGSRRYFKLFREHFGDAICDEMDLPKDE